MRGTAAAFVDAYAAAGQDRASALRGLVAGRTLPTWAHWMGVQNEQFPGTIVGGATVAVVGPAHGASLVDVTTDDRFVREVDLVAQVDLQATPTQGEPIPLTWVLDGPMLFVTDPRGDWKVTDFHRDGIPMSVIFQVVDEVDLADGPRVQVSLDSFVAVPTWQFNLVVTVERGSPIALSAGGVTLVDGAGDVVEEAGEVTEGLSSIEAGAPAEGVVAFRARSDATGLLLRLRVPITRAGERTTSRSSRSHWKVSSNPSRSPIRPPHHRPAAEPRPTRTGWRSSSERQRAIAPKKTSGGEPGVDALVREPVGLGVALTPDMLVLHVIEPGSQRPSLTMQGLQVRGLDPEPSGQLIDQQERIAQQVHTRGTELLGSLQPLDRGGVLSHVVRRLADAIGDLGDHHTVGVGDLHADPRRPRVAPCRAVAHDPQKTRIRRQCSHLRRPSVFLSLSNCIAESCS